MLGVAWPSIQRSFGLSMDAVGALLLTVTAGSLLTSFASGPVISRIGMGRFLSVSTAAAVVGLVGYALAPTWWLLALLGLLVGAAEGAVDSGLNVYFVRNHGPRLMNWLHACFGLGSALGPAIMTLVLSSSQSWRWGYAIAGGLQAILAICFGLTRRRWQISRGDLVGGRPPAGSATATATLRLPAVWLNVLLFCILSGITISAGQWPYSLFTEARLIAPSTAGFWVSVYWAGLTVGRVAYGIAGDRLEVVSSLRAGIVTIICGAAFVWWNRADALTLLGMALIGLGLAPLFPLLQLVTPERVGTEHAPNAVGFQVAGARIGSAGLSGLAGTLAERFGLETVGPLLLASAIAMLMVHEAIVARKPLHHERATTR